MYVIGTAGHVDHGKSTLISALTGINPDRLKEEQERQMTIDLGFAWFTLPSGEEIGIVDVPGHRDFIENMLAGVGGIDAVLFVVAADEGIMPQSREHLDILKLIGIEKGLIVLTKVDLVEDEDWIEMVESDVCNLAKDSFLENAPIIHVSAVKKTGLNELSIQLDELLKGCKPGMNTGIPRMPIDRIFSLKGFGTVVTGTLIEGKLSVGDQVEILPSGISTRIRGIQNHKKKQQSADPGNRTAVNLVGVDVGQISRGDVLCLPGQYKATTLIDTAIVLLDDNLAQIKHDDRVKIFIGTAQTTARARVVGEKLLASGKNGWVQFVLDNEVIARKKDRFIIRRPSPASTIGGGTVLDVHPSGRHKRFAKDVIDRFTALAKNSPDEEILMTLDDLGITTTAELIRVSEFNRKAIFLIIKELIRAGEIVNLGKDDALDEGTNLISKKKWMDLSSRLLDSIKSFHQEYPLREGKRIEDCARDLRLSRSNLVLIAGLLKSEDKVTISGSIIKLRDHSIIFSKEQALRIKKLEEELQKTFPQAPSADSCIKIAGVEVYKALIAGDTLLELTSSVVFRREDLDEIISRTKKLLSVQKKITVADFRDYFNTSRKYAVALLEYMDSIGVTHREGDFRTFKNG